MVGPGVLLADAELAKFVLESVAAALAAVSKRVVNTMPLSVRVDSGMPWVVAGSGKAATTIGSGDAVVGGDRQGVAGVVVEPGEDFDVGAIGEAVVGEVGLPGFVGLLGGEADVGGLRFLLGFGDDEAGAADDPVDRRSRHGELVVVLKVPGDRVGAGIEALGGELSAEFDDEVDRCGRCGVGAGVGSS